MLPPLMGDLQFHDPEDAETIQIRLSGHAFVRVVQNRSKDQCKNFMLR